MTDPTTLSPAAQAVVAAIEKFDWEDGHFFREEIWHCSREVVAAALRAAVDQVVPLTLEEELFCRNHSLSLQKMVEIRLQLLAIADELEAQ